MYIYQFQYALRAGPSARALRLGAPLKEALVRNKSICKVLSEMRTVLKVCRPLRADPPEHQRDLLKSRQI